MEDQTLDSVEGLRSEAKIFVLEYAVFDNLTIGTAFGLFNAKSKSDYEVEETDLYLTSDWKEHISFEFAYAQVNDKNVSGEDHQLRAILTYNY